MMLGQLVKAWGRLSQVEISQSESRVEEAYPTKRSLDTISLSATKKQKMSQYEAIIVEAHVAKESRSSNTNKDA